jgi:hypothetical protein
MLHIAQRTFKSARSPVIAYPGLIHTDLLAILGLDGLYEGQEPAHAPALNGEQSRKVPGNY